MLDNEDWNLRLECIDRAQRIGVRVGETISEAARIEKYVRTGEVADDTGSA